MQLLGLVLRKPTLGELTAAAVMATGLWVCIAGLAKAAGQPLVAHDAGALLVVIAWACVGARLGLRFDRGLRPVVANVVVSATLLGGYELAMAAVSASVSA